MNDLKIAYKYAQLKAKAKKLELPFNLTQNDLKNLYFKADEDLIMYLKDKDKGYTLKNIVLDTRQNVGKYRQSSKKYGATGIRYDKTKDAYRVYDENNNYLGFSKTLCGARKIALWEK